MQVSCSLKPVLPLTASGGAFRASSPRQGCRVRPSTGSWVSGNSRRTMRRGARGRRFGSKTRCGRGSAASLACRRPRQRLPEAVSETCFEPRLLQRNQSARRTVDQKSHRHGDGRARRRGRKGYSRCQTERSCRVHPMSFLCRHRRLVIRPANGRVGRLPTLFHRLTPMPTFQRGRQRRGGC